MCVLDRGHRKQTYLDVLISFFGREGTRITEQIDEANSDATIDVEDQLKRGYEQLRLKFDSNTHSVLLRGGDLLDSKGVVEQAVAREVLAHILLDELDAQIGVVDALDLVADTGDCTSAG